MNLSDINNPAPNFDRSIQLGPLITTIINTMYPLVGILLLIYLLWGAFELLTSGGDKGKVQSAQKRMTYALIGFALVIFAFLITQIVKLLLPTQF